MAFALSTEINAGEAVVTVTGRLDRMAVSLVRAEMLGLIRCGGPETGVRVAVDLRSITYVDATGMGVLLLAHKETLASGGALRLVIDRECLLDAFAAAGLTSVFHIDAAE